MRVTVTGASGFIGRHLIGRLQTEGHTVCAIGRHAPAIPEVEFAPWNAGEEPPPEALISEAIVHLAGEPVAQRWSGDVKRRIRDSRVMGTRNLVAAIARLSHKPNVLVASSAIGYYGDRGDEILTEASGPGRDFLAGVCVEWERESHAAAALG